MVFKKHFSKTFTLTKSVYAMGIASEQLSVGQQSCENYNIVITQYLSLEDAFKCLQQCTKGDVHNLNDLS